MTTASTARFNRVRRAFSQFDVLVFGMVRLPKNRPLLQDKPTYTFVRRRKCAIISATGVLPFSPQIPTTGIRKSAPGGKRWFAISLPTGCGLPLAGFRCIKRPGPAFTSTIAAFCSANGRLMSFATKSTPAISRPTTRAAKATWKATSG